MILLFFPLYSLSCKERVGVRSWKMSVHTQFLRNFGETISLEVRAWYNPYLILNSEMKCNDYLKFEEPLPNTLSPSTPLVGLSLYKGKIFKKCFLLIPISDYFFNESIIFSSSISTSFWISSDSRLSFISESVSFSI
jgi:hypothetical protein